MSPPIEIVPSFIAFSKRRQLASLRDKFDVALKRFKATPDYRHLLEKYRLESSLDLQKALLRGRRLSAGELATLVRQYLESAET
ncbi:hypothetical protein LP420_02805 [Massilia sp. B-10]|nr:hypothetical protein LP420_02805 [Massilia sp. B-10]